MPDGLSIAFQGELLAWVSALAPPPRSIFLVHGEPEPAEAPAALLREKVSATVRAPAPGEEHTRWN